MGRLANPRQKMTWNRWYFALFVHLGYVCSQFVQCIDDGVTILPLDSVIQHNQRSLADLITSFYLQQTLLHAVYSIPRIKSVVVWHTRRLGTWSCMASMSKNTCRGGSRVLLNNGPMWIKQLWPFLFPVPFAGKTSDEPAPMTVYLFRTSQVGSINTPPRFRLLFLINNNNNNNNNKYNNSLLISSLFAMTKG